MDKKLCNVPPVNPILRWIATFIIWAMGWKLDGLPPDRAKMVMIGAPHTSNLDVFLMVMMSWKMGINVSYLVADDLAFPLNHLTVWSNGIQIDRNRPNSNTVQQVVDYMNNVERCALMIAPEGRLRRVEYWGSGFYYIALGAGVPVVPSYMDYARKTIGIGESFVPSGDVDADMAALRDFYADVTPRFPEKASLVRLRPRTDRMQQRLHERHNGADGSTPDAEPEEDAEERRAVS